MAALAREEIDNEVAVAADWRRLGAALLHQQAWCWGRDIRRPEGNLLLAHGFERWRPPEGEAGSRRYTLALPDGASVTLWSFGLAFGWPPGPLLLLRRLAFAPEMLLAAGLERPVWLAAHLPPTHAPTTPAERAWARRALPAALGWIAAYERWVLATAGAAYRAAALADWPAAKHACPGPAMAATWAHLAAAVANDEALRPG